MIEVQRAKDERERQAVEADVNRHFELSIELARKKMGASSSWGGQLTKEEEYQAREQLARHGQYSRAPPPAHGAPPPAHGAHPASSGKSAGGVDPRVDPRYGQYSPKSSLPSPRADPKLDHRVIPRGGTSVVRASTGLPTVLLVCAETSRSPRYHSV